MKKILCNDKPFISCYPEYGFVFSLTEDVTEPWVMDNFIEFELVPEWELFISFINHDSILKECPYISEKTILRSEPVRDNADIVGFVIESISKDTCLFLFLDRFYISGTEEYHLKHYMHNAFVVGCDTDAGIIYLADNFNDGKYSVLECSFDDFRNAFARDHESHVYENELQNKYSGNLVEYLKDILSRKEAAYVFAERSDIKAFSYGFPYAHDQKIVGHSTLKRRFYIEDHYSKKPIVSCSYKEIKKAYRRFPKQEQLDEIVMIEKIGRNTVEKIDVAKIVHSLEEYLCPSATETKRDGFTVLHNIFALEAIADKPETLDKTRYRFWQFLYEWAMLMEVRVRRLCELNIICADDDFLKSFVRLKKGYLMLRNLFIKADIEKTGIDSTITDTFREVLTSEKELLTRLIQMLKAYLKDTDEEVKSEQKM